MSQPYLAEIRVFGFNFAPLGWAFCSGEILSIAQNTAVFSLVGTTYGGNGTSNFALPNLQNNIAVGFGQGPGLQNWSLGETQGEATHTLLINEMAQHTHTATAGDGVAFGAQTAAPASNSYLGRERGGAYGVTPTTTLAASAIGQGGGNQPHNNVQPILAMNYSIALNGIFPSRN
jgi:microcystin-dependent protein